MKGLGAEALAALGATTGDYLAATQGRHAGAESVGAFTLDSTGLKSALHGGRLRKVA